jgi:hypothetical protein
MSVVDEVFHFYLHGNMFVHGVLKEYQEAIKELYYD